MFILNRLTQVLREKEGGDSGANQPTGGAPDFQPTEIHQGEGILDMRQEAEHKQQQQEDTGSVLEDNTEDPQDDSGDDSTEGEQPATEEENSSQDDSQEASGANEPDYTYKGVSVEVTNTPEMEQAFKDKGIDIDAVNKEIYSESGLTEETKTKLDEAFGKMSVDMYLDGLHKANEATVQSHQAEQAKVNERLDTIATEATGGKFNEVMKWANDNLSSEDYQAYQTIVNGTDELQVKLALEDLTRRSGLNPLQPPIVKGNKDSVEQTLITPTNTEEGDANSPITGQEYRDAITSGEYKKDSAKWDARRQAGIDAGIGMYR